MHWGVAHAPQPLAAAADDDNDDDDESILKSPLPGLTFAREGSRVVAEFNFSGTGGLYPYAVGIVGALQDHIDTSRMRFVSSSGSAPASFCALLNVPALQALKAWETMKKRVLKEHGIQAIVTDMQPFMVHVFAQAIAKHASSEYRATAPTRHAVWVTNTRTLRRELIEKHENEQSWLCASVASLAFKQVPSARCPMDWPYGHAHGPFMDGEMVCTKPPKIETARSGNSCMRFPLPHARSTWLSVAVTRWMYVVTGLVTNQSWSYSEGYADAMREIIPRCVRAGLGRRQSIQTRSNNPNHSFSRIDLYMLFKDAYELSAASSPSAPSSVATLPVSSMPSLSALRAAV